MALKKKSTKIQRIKNEKWNWFEILVILKHSVNGASIF